MKSHQKKTTTNTTAQNTLSAQLDAELADLGGFNASPKASIEDSSDEEEPARPRRRLKRKAEMLHELPEPRKGREIIDSEEDEQEMQCPSTKINTQAISYVVSSR